MRRLQIRLLPLVLSIAFVGATAHRVVAAPTPTACSDTADAREWQEYFADDFVSTDSESVEFRHHLDLRRVDSTAVIGPVTSAGVCASIAAVTRGRLSHLAYPYRLVFVRFGDYYVVVVIDTSPRVGDLVIARRSLALILSVSNLAVITDAIIA